MSIPGQDLQATLVWDGGDEVWVPEEAGEPRDDQLQGTVGERLCELAGRNCYRSVGCGRPSSEYHDNILKYKHYSIYEHYNFTIRIYGSKLDKLVFPLMNRPGIWVDNEKYGQVAITYNPRVVLDWDQREWGGPDLRGIYPVLKRCAHEKMPNVVGGAEGLAVRNVAHIEPENDNQRWISMYLKCSRGVSHEQVRHGDYTAISQRSTRYVGEYETPYINHPILRKYVEGLDMDTVSYVDTAEYISKAAYKKLVDNLQGMLEEDGIDSRTARKQARGAARGYLGNALETDMIFSANVMQWKWMVNMRCSNAADAEIRLLYNQVVKELLKSRYSDRFKFQVEQAKDGIGKVYKPEEWV